MKPGRFRAQALADFRAGKTQALTNVAVLTGGFDDPGVSCVAMARPTRSEGLYAQCVGRGTRLYPEKKDCPCSISWTCRASACSLPSLFGALRELDLAGGDAEGEARVAADPLRSPGLRARGRRATLGGDPGRVALPTLRGVTDEVAPSLPNAWFSLGHFMGSGSASSGSPGARARALVLKQPGRAGKWEVTRGRAGRRPLRADGGGGGGRLRARADGPPHGRVGAPGRVWRAGPSSGAAARGRFAHRFAGRAPPARGRDERRSPHGRPRSTGRPPD